jgi:lysophospholipase L1-like esterase
MRENARMHLRSTALGAVALAGLLLFTGCGSAQVPHVPTPTFHHYVALGDTFTAAPYTGRTVDQACLRARNNYPHRLAAALRIKGHLKDVSCHLATTGAVSTGQRIGQVTVAPQIKAVRRTTDLVTIGLGGNDRNMYALLGTTCANAVGSCPLARYEPLTDLAIASVRLAVATQIRAVQDRAPRATVVVVGYPRHVEANSNCAVLPRMSRADRLAWGRIDVALNLALSRAARDTAADFVDVYDASKGHDICSSSPWVRGDRTIRSAGLAFGPPAAAQIAVATLIKETIATDDTGAVG